MIQKNYRPIISSPMMLKIYLNTVLWVQYKIKIKLNNLGLEDSVHVLW